MAMACHFCAVPFVRDGHASMVMPSPKYLWSNAMRLWTVNSAVFIRLAGSFSIIRVCGGAAMRMGGLGRLGRHSLTRGVYPFRSAAAQSAGPRIMTAMTLVEMAGGDFNGWFRVSGMLEPDERENQEAYNG